MKRKLSNSAIIGITLCFLFGNISGAQTPPDFSIISQLESNVGTLSPATLLNIRPNITLSDSLLGFFTYDELLTNNYFEIGRAHV